MMYRPALMSAGTTSGWGSAWTVRAQVHYRYAAILTKKVKRKIDLPGGRGIETEKDRLLSHACFCWGRCRDKRKIDWWSMPKLTFVTWNWIEIRVVPVLLACE